jgi:hypothetical protein
MNKIAFYLTVNTPSLHYIEQPINDVYEITEPINSVCRQNVKLLNSITCGTYSYQRVVHTVTNVWYIQVLTCGTNSYQRVLKGYVYCNSFFETVSLLSYRSNISRRY